jgi:DNA-binding ferritin-like protein
MEQHIKIGALYIATLKAISLIAQHQHWLSRGNAFYSSHLLFERIYNSALKDLDLAAEKFVGLFGDKVLSYDLQTELLHKVLKQFSTLEGSSGASMLLAIEKQFLKFSEEAEKAFGEEMTQGLFDALGAIASSREESVYLLQQTLKDE